MNNIKIEINKDQPLDEVVKELERMGCKRDSDCHDPSPLFGIVVFAMDESFNTSDEKTFNWQIFNSHKLTTLAELKEMK